MLGVPLHLLQVQPDVHHLPHILQDSGSAAYHGKEEEGIGGGRSEKVIRFALKNRLIYDIIYNELPNKLRV